MQHWPVFLGNILFQTAVYLYFIIVPFHKSFRFSGKVTAGLVSIYIALLAGVILTFLEIGAPLGGYPVVGIIILTVVSIGTAILLIRGNPLQLLFTVLMTVNLQNNAIYLAKLLNQSGVRLVVSGFEGLNYILLAVVVVVFMIPFYWFLMIKLYRPVIESQADFPFWKYLWMIPLAFGLFFNLHLMPSYGGKTVLSVSDFVVYFTWMSCIYLTFCTILIMLAETYRKIQADEKLRLADQQIQMQRVQYEKQQESIRLFSQMRHDFRHHILTMRRFLQAKQYEDLLRYLDGFQVSDLFDEGAQLCENPAVDAVLRHYTALAKNAGIDMQVSVDAPRESPVLENDLCSIFGNLVENALEACCRQQGSEKFIQVSAKTSGDKRMAITVKNSYEKPVVQKKGIFSSSKRAGNGVGITSVQNLAERYCGQTRFVYGNGVFEAYVLLNP